MSDDQDSDTIKFEDAINDSEASTKKRLLGIDAKVSRLKESQGSLTSFVDHVSISKKVDSLFVICWKESRLN